jgi:hypothetical protein
LTNTSDQDQILVKFEEENLADPYKEYYAAKRNNFFATIFQLPALWEGFMLLDKIVFRELEDMKTTNQSGRMLPMILFMNGHAKMRIALELGCSMSLPEAHSILRDAIESIAHGHRTLGDPELQRVWVSKEDDKKSFELEFLHSKAERLFEGLPELHQYWKRLSESGSHTSMNSLISRFGIEEDSVNLTWKLDYTGVNQRIFLPALIELLHVFHLMENVVFKDCEGRLKFDTDLVSWREKLQRDIQKLLPMARISP